MSNRNYILSKEAALEKLHRMALEIAEQISEDNVPVMLIGVKQNGLVIAEKIAHLLRRYVSVEVQLLSVTLDKAHPGNAVLSEAVDLNDKNIIVVDDVINSGRTLLYALKPLLQYLPRRIQTLVLVERMHKLYPIKPDYVGSSIATTLQDHISVVVENGEVTGAYVN
ncbi:phosphoribosyltransferase family protein [Deminuibacter soli]|uniref:Phosphoribosyltransferase n=1 Tax=Deminuibacter soli TaxID=2291815 RepID=A0A3E1NJG2_9BACT|nr:phosphoribosyltransferase family protein [Deminuibacter soli]RFM28070.1 phosphoribosyltransferase [Deminuibacter soli]